MTTAQSVFFYACLGLSTLSLIAIAVQLGSVLRTLLAIGETLVILARHPSAK